MATDEPVSEPDLRSERALEPLARPLDEPVSEPDLRSERALERTSGPTPSTSPSPRRWRPTNLSASVTSGASERSATSSANEAQGRALGELVVATMVTHGPVSERDLRSELSTTSSPRRRAPVLTNAARPRIGADPLRHQQEFDR